MLWVILLAVVAYIAYVVYCKIQCYKLDKKIEETKKELEDKFGKW